MIINSVVGLDPQGTSREVYQFSDTLAKCHNGLGYSALFRSTEGQYLLFQLFDGVSNAK